MERERERWRERKGNSWNGLSSTQVTHISRVSSIHTTMAVQWADLPPDLVGVLADALTGHPSDVAAMRLVCR